MKRPYFLLLLSALTLPGYATITAYEFDTPQQEQVYQDLTEELRCLVCQNQNIADSNAELAQDLRREIYTMLKAGKDKRAVVDFMVQRYGDFVLYRPPVEPRTWGLWFGPIILFVAGVGALWMIIRRRAQQAQRQSGVLTPQEQERLARLLNENKDR